MTLLILFITTFIISFLGSIHPGPLNVSVVETTLTTGLKAGLIMAIGGCIPEFIYSWLAVEGSMLFQRNKLIFNGLQWAMVFILICMGVFTIFAKEKPVKNKVIKASLFFKGFLLSAFNPQLIVFWLLIIIYFQKFDFLAIHSAIDKVVFVLGTGVGAFLLNFLYANWSFAKKDYIFKHINQKIFNLLIGFSFIFMALFQLFKLISV
jgi:threonine/homoserine/homoserine lactone efflux protein